MARRKFKPKTTMSNHDKVIHENVLARRFKVESINEVWLADITYLATKEGWVYLAAVMDQCSRQIVGWDLSDSLEASGATNALNLALINRNPEEGLIHHSDRGVQYASKKYQDLLGKYKCICSMSRKGNCWDNAPMESFFGRLKEEIGMEVFETRQMATQAGLCGRLCKKSKSTKLMKRRKK
jgi:transposase InsO family protein